MNDSNRLTYFRPTKLTGMDEGEYFIGFAKKCTCEKPPSPCICKPEKVNANGIESGDIFFDRKSYLFDGSPTFEFMSGLFKKSPIILGYAEQDTGKKNKGKMILKWKIPKIKIKCHKLPVIDSSNTRTPQRCYKTGQHPTKQSSPKRIKKRMTPHAAHAEVFVPSKKEEPVPGTASIFSTGSGTMIPKMWMSEEKIFEKPRGPSEDKPPSESRFHIWVTWDSTSIPTLPGITPPLLDVLKTPPLLDVTVE